MVQQDDMTNDQIVLHWIACFSQVILYLVEIRQNSYGYEAVKPPAGAESESVQLNESFLLREG